MLFLRFYIRADLNVQLAERLRACLVSGSGWFFEQIFILMTDV